MEGQASGTSIEIDSGVRQLVACDATGGTGVCHSVSSRPSRSSFDNVVVCMVTSYPGLIVYL